MPGQIKGKVPSLVTVQNIVANKIANIVVPQTTQTIFAGLIDAQKASGSYVDPRQMMNMTATSMSKTPVVGSSMEALRNQLSTRDDLGLRLPNLAYKPKQGIATSVGQKHQDEEINASEWQVAGGVGAAAQGKETQYVDDNGWPVTLKQILGSRLLSREMLEKASIQNMDKYVIATGGTAQQREEIKYMYQRAMLEGFLHGVDITKGMDKGAIRFKIADSVSSKGSVIGVHTLENGDDVVKFKTSFWNSKSDAEQYTLFLHEVVGHSILNVNASHNNSTSKKFQQANRVMTPVYKTTITENYNTMMDGLFKERSAPNAVKVGTHDYGKAATYDASWFPPLTGVTDTGKPTTPDTPGANPNDAGGTDGGDKPNITNVTNNTFQPQEMVDLGGGGGNSNVNFDLGSRAQPVQAQTTMAPTATPGAGGNAFAAGMADLSTRLRSG